MSLALRHATVLRPTMAERVKQGLVGYWPLALEGAVDLRSYDSSGVDLTLTNNNGVTRAAGPSSNLPDAADFEQDSTQYLSGPSTLVIPPTARNVTWNFWFQLESVGVTNRLLWSQDDVSGNNRSWAFLVFPAGTSVVAQLSSIGSNRQQFTITPTTLTTATWYMLTVFSNYPSGFVSGVLNAGALNSGAHDGVNYTGTLFATSVSMLFGAQWNGVSLNSGSHDGLLAHAGIWLRNLTSSEIAWLYNNGQGRDLRRLA